MNRSEGSAMPVPANANSAIDATALIGEGRGSGGEHLGGEQRGDGGLLRSGVPDRMLQGRPT